MPTVSIDIVKPPEGTHTKGPVLTALILWAIKATLALSCGQAMRMISMVNRTWTALVETQIKSKRGD